MIEQPNIQKRQVMKKQLVPKNNELKAQSPKDLIKTLFAEAGIGINGSNTWDIRVYDDRFYKRMVKNRNLGMGESYMEGWWDCEQPDEMIYRLLRSGAERKIRENLRYLIRFLPALLINPQSRSRGHIIARHHYDLDNDLFLSFLDSYNQYSCGYFKATHDLNEAQQKKLEMICTKLDLRTTDHLLDIGCGWGGFAKFAVEKYGCTITAVNISKEQLRYARKFCEGLPVTFRQCDYRSLRGRFDKIVSIGMFEHVGYKNYRTFMKVVRNCLTDDGIFMLQTIGGNISRFGCDPWISKYIFPNGMLPSIAQIGKAAEGLFVIEDWHNLGPHYDKTLMAWNHNFQQAWPELKKRYDETFKRMWEYYLLSCAGAFRAREIQVWQIVMTKSGSGRPQPRCRF